MNTTTYQNWRPVVASLIWYFQEKGYDITGTEKNDNHKSIYGTRRQQRQRAKKRIVEDRHEVLWLVKDEQSFCVSIILRDSADIVKDHSPDLIDIINEFRAEWRGREIPNR